MVHRSWSDWFAERAGRNREKEKFRAELIAAGWLKETPGGIVFVPNAATEVERCGGFYRTRQYFKGLTNWYSGV